MAEGKLNPRQQLFVREYLKSRNAADAYRKAGYKAKNNHAAAVGAHQLMTKPDIAAAIEEGLAALNRKVEVDAETVLREVLHVASSDIGDILDFSGDDLRLRRACDIPVQARRAISSVKVTRTLRGGEGGHPVESVEFKLWNKVAALEKLMKHLGLLVEKHEHSGHVTTGRPDDAPVEECSDDELDRIIAEGDGGEGETPPPAGEEQPS